MLTFEEVDDYIESKYAKKLQKPVKRGFDESVFPSLKWKEGGEIPLKYIRFLIKDIPDYKSEMKIPAESKFVLGKIEPQSGQAFATTILKYIEENGGFINKNIFLYQIMACLGGKDVIKAIRNQIVWKTFINFAKLLRFNNSLDAARTLLEIPKSYKKRGVIVQTCEKTFNQIAIQRRIAVVELREMLVPNFGFDGLYYSFQTEDEKRFKACVNPQFKLNFIDEANEIHEKLPKLTSKEIKTTFKTIQKEIKTFVKTEKVVLENAMCGQRRWLKEDWENHFLKHPVLNIFAQQLVWGIFDKDGRLLNTFMVDEDLTLENVSYDEIELKSSDSISIIHPIQLSKEQLEMWKKYWIENKIIPVFSQLNREVFKRKGRIIDPKLSEKKVEFHIIRAEFLSGVSCTFIEKKALIHLVSEYEKFDLPIMRKVINIQAISTYKDTNCPDILERGKERGWSNERIFMMKPFELLGVDVFLRLDYKNRGCTIGNIFFVKRQSAIDLYTNPDIKEKESRFFPLYELAEIMFSEVRRDVLFFMD